jgi:hypothetical protein
MCLVRHKKNKSNGGMAPRRKRCKRWYQSKLLGQLQNLLGHLREVNNPKQMALDKLIPNTMAMGQPKAKQKYEIKKKKEKDIAMEELVAVV